MKFSVNSEKISALKTDALILMFLEDSAQFKKDPFFAQLNKDGQLTGKHLEVSWHYRVPKFAAKYVICVGLGKKEELTLDRFQHAVGEGVRRANALKAKRVHVALDAGAQKQSDLVLLGNSVAQGTLLGLYEFNRYKTARDLQKLSVSEASLVWENKKDSTKINAGFEHGSVVAQATNFARDLANTPANDLMPIDFVNIAKREFKSAKGFKLQVIDQKQAKKLGMNAFLGVAQGSVSAPYMLVIEYTAGKGKNKTALVGKGVTFDSGGISIKPAANMAQMKADMSGAAAVLATMKALTALRPKESVLAVMPLVENMPSGSAQRPGDVVKAMNGKTIEIINTDAEGRLILADALCYAVKQGATQIVDIATLTGACVVALGTKVAGLFTNHQQFADHLRSLETRSGERLWQLPMYDEYKEDLKSIVADIAHCSESRYGGAITAAKFLEEFVSKKPWVHLDIASTMDYTKTCGYSIKGMSGTGTRVLIELVMSGFHATDAN